MNIRDKVESIAFEKIKALNNSNLHKVATYIHDLYEKEQLMKQMIETGIKMGE